MNAFAGGRQRFRRLQPQPVARDIPLPANGTDSVAPIVEPAIAGAPSIRRAEHWHPMKAARDKRVAPVWNLGQEPAAGERRVSRRGDADVCREANAAQIVGWREFKINDARVGRVERIDREVRGADDAAVRPTKYLTRRGTPEFTAVFKRFVDHDIKADEGHAMGSPARLLRRRPLHRPARRRDPRHRTALLSRALLQPRQRDLGPPGS
jgi:hypothetical protein